MSRTEDSQNTGDGPDNLQKRDMTMDLGACVDPECPRFYFYHKAHPKDMPSAPCYSMQNDDKYGVAGS